MFLVVSIFLCAFNLTLANSCGSFFTRDLKMLSEGVDVQTLQLFLNSNSATQIAPYGIGSPGNETRLYGYATTDAVKRFQRINGLEESGIFGFSERLLLILQCPADFSTKQLPQEIIQQPSFVNQDIKVENTNAEPPYSTSSLVVVAVPDLTNSNSTYLILPGKQIVQTVGTSSPQATQVLNEVLQQIPTHLSDKYLQNIVLTNTNSTNSDKLATTLLLSEINKFSLTIYIDQYQKLPKHERLLTVAHELSHMMSMTVENYNFAQASSTCQTYVDINGICYKEESVLNQFYRYFWNGRTRPQVYADSFYVDEYAATEAAEDFSESFAYYVFKDNIYLPNLTPTRILQAPILMQKINFFNKFGQYVDAKMALVNLLKF